MTDYNIYSIRSYNNNKLVFYNYTKRKRIGDILSGLKTRFKRHLNNKDNWVNVFYILKQDNSYIKIEEHIVNSNDEIVKSRLCEIIANNKCINKMRNEDIWFYLFENIIRILCIRKIEKKNKLRKSGYIVDFPDDYYTYPYGYSNTTRSIWDPTVYSRYGKTYSYHDIVPKRKIRKRRKQRL